MICTDYASFRNVFMAGEPVALDGFPTWDATRFDGTLFPFTGWQQTFPISVQMTGGTDAVAGVDEYHWYLSQPTERTEPRLSLTLRTPASGTTNSGRTWLGLTAVGSALLAGESLGPAHSAQAMDSFLRNTYIYSYDIANNKYYATDLHRLAFAPQSLAI